MFTLDKFDDWKIRMQTDIFAMHDELWDVITNVPIQIMKINTVFLLDPNVDQYISKPKMEWTSEDRTRNNLNNIARDILSKYVDENIFFKD